MFLITLVNARFNNLYLRHDMPSLIIVKIAIINNLKLTTWISFTIIMSDPTSNYTNIINYLV